MMELLNISRYMYNGSDGVLENQSDWGINETFENVRRGEKPFIPLYIYISVSIINLLLFLAGVFGNIMVILVIIKVRDMRTPTNYFLLSLSMADIFVLLICQPAALMEFYAKDRWFLGAAMFITMLYRLSLAMFVFLFSIGKLIYNGSLIGKIVPLMENGMLHVSILTMLAVTAERYNALCHPFKRRLSCTISTTIKIIACIWIFGYLLTLPFFIMTQLESANFYDGTKIKVCRTKIDQTWKYSYIVFVFVVFFALPFFVIVFMYSKIIKQLVSDTLRTLTRNDPSTIYTLQSRKQVVRMLIFIIVLFFVSLFPMRVVSLWLIFTPTKDVVKIGLEAYLNLVSWARIFMYVNSAGNPIIYSITSTKFKIAFNRVLRRYDPFAKGSTAYSTKYSFTRRSRRNGNLNTLALTTPNNNSSPSQKIKPRVSSSGSGSRSNPEFYD